MNYIGKEYNQKPSLSNSTPIQELYSIRERIKHYPQWQSCRRSVLFIMPAFKNGHFLNIQSFLFSEVIHVSLHINANKYFKMNYTWKGLHLAYINQQDDYGFFFNCCATILKGRVIELKFLFCCCFFLNLYAILYISSLHVLYLTLNSCNIHVLSAIQSYIILVHVIGIN